MKALEKAAKDRVETNGDPTTPAASSAVGAPGSATSAALTLEPMTAPTAAPTSAAPPRAQSTAARKAAAAPAMPAATPREPAQAAAVIRAGQRETSGSMVAYLRDRPLMTFGTLAVLFLIGFGGYVYVQMNPGMFVTQTPRPAPSAPIAQAPAPVSPVGGANSTSPAVPQPVALTSLLPPTQPIADKQKSVPPTPVAAAQLPAPAPAATAPATPREAIKVTTGNATPTINPLLSEAYSALAAGNLESSQRLYNQLIKSDPRNIEALLGLAAIATQQGDRDAATRQYVRVLELDPRNTLAQAGLIGMVGRADPQAAETRVKQLIARDPNAAYLYFTLGNTYVDQNRWPDAQQAFFQAHNLQPDNPDYAYNLAVALEHIGQSKPALDFYRRAVLLAAAKGHANFSTAAAQERVGKLEKLVQ